MSLPIAKTKKRIKFFIGYKTGKRIRALLIMPLLLINVE